MGLKSSQASSEKESRGRSDYRRNEGKVRMQAEVGVMWPQAKERRQRLEEA